MADHHGVISAEKKFNYFVVGGSLGSWLYVIRVLRKSLEFLKGSPESVLNLFRVWYLWQGFLGIWQVFLIWAFSVYTVFILINSGIFCSKSRNKDNGLSSAFSLKVWIRVCLDVLLLYLLESILLFLMALPKFWELYTFVFSLLFSLSFYFYIF